MAHPSHGYRWVTAYIRINEKVTFSESFVYKAFRFLGFQSETKHKEHTRARKQKDRYPNLIYTTWDTVDRPRQVIVSDMTVLHVWIFYIEVTFYFDVFTKQILTWKMAERRGDRNQYIDGMVDIVSLLHGSKYPTIVDIIRAELCQLPVDGTFDCIQIQRPAVCAFGIVRSKMDLV